MSTSERNEPLIEARDISKSFGAMKVLRDVEMSFERGRVHGLVGANGAGKSTFLNIVGGVLRPDSGTISVDGVPTVVTGPRHAADLGFSFIYQELALIPQFSAWENMTLRMRPKTVLGVGDRGYRRKAAQAVADKLHLQLDLEKPVSSLSVAERGLVAIGRALVGEARFIAMDEPTAALSDAECVRLFQIIQELKAQGVAIAYVSHRLDEVEDLCDNVTVFRNGEVALRLQRGGYTRKNLVEGIAGDATVSEKLARRRSPTFSSATPVLEVRKLSSPPRVKNVSFELFEGEILGLAGLVGSGRTELARMIFGAERPASGEMLLWGRPFAPTSTRDAIAQGLALVPEERRTQGLVMEETISFNTSLGNAAAFRRKGSPLVDERKARSAAKSVMDRLMIKAGSSGARVATLSGGNQQKVVLGRWLLRNARIMVLDEPSRGVDVRARQQIWDAIGDFVSKGGAAVVISSELEELEACDRIVVMAEGRSVGELKADDVTETKMLELIYSAKETHLW
jgi:ABC-type sugar transport system ATPase subunit